MAVNIMQLKTWIARQMIIIDTIVNLATSHPQSGWLFYFIYRPAGNAPADN